MLPLGLQHHPQPRCQLQQAKHAKCCQACGMDQDGEAQAAPPLSKDFQLGPYHSCGVPEDVHCASRASGIARPLKHRVRHVRGIYRILHLKLEHARVELRRLGSHVTHHEYSGNGLEGVKTPSRQHKDRLAQTYERPRTTARVRRFT